MNIINNSIDNSIDNSIEYIQQKIIYSINAYESYIVEYFCIPLFFEWIFHSDNYKIFRCFLLSLLILRQFIILTNLKSLIFRQNQFLLPFLAYSVLNNNITSITTYTLIYSTNIYESCLLASISYFSNSYYNFYTGYIMHILYLLCRNNLKIVIEKDEQTQGIYIRPNPKLIPDINKRLEKIKYEIDKFINDRLDYLLE